MSFCETFSFPFLSLYTSLVDLAFQHPLVAPRIDPKNRQITADFKTEFLSTFKQNPLIKVVLTDLRRNDYTEFNKTQKSIDKT
jgi:hypothetical protein